MSKTNNIQNKSKLRIAACFVVILMVLAACLPMMTSCKIFSSEIVIKQLTIDVNVGANGTTTFTETAKAKFSEQDTDWWNFYRIIDDQKLISALRKEGNFSIDKDSFYLDGVQIPFEGAIDLDAADAKEKYGLPEAEHDFFTCFHDGK